MKEMLREDDSLTLAEVLYTVTRPKYHKGKNIRNDLLSVDDADMYTAIELALKEIKTNKI